MAKESESVNRYRLCPNCGNFSHFQEEQYYCILCGTKLVEHCTRCGEPIFHPQGRFCHNCGGSYRTAPVEGGQQ